jgi:hypothetical protein
MERPGNYKVDGKVPAWRINQKYIPVLNYMLNDLDLIEHKDFDIVLDQKRYRNITNGKAKTGAYILVFNSDRGLIRFTQSVNKFKIERMSQKDFQEVIFIGV